MKKNYTSPITEIIDIDLNQSLLSSSDTVDTRPSDCPCKNCPYRK